MGLRRGEIIEKVVVRNLIDNRIGLNWCLGIIRFMLGVF